MKIVQHTNLFLIYHLDKNVFYLGDGMLWAECPSNAQYWAKLGISHQVNKLLSQKDVDWENIVVVTMKDRKIDVENYIPIVNFVGKNTKDKIFEAMTVRQIAAYKMGDSK